MTISFCPQDSDSARQRLAVRLGCYDDYDIRNGKLADYVFSTIRQINVSQGGIPHSGAVTYRPE
jgi:hypothetical protein